MGNASALAGLLLLFGTTSASPVSAQPATVEGSYARLSNGNAKIARALFEAQTTPTQTGTAAGTSLPRPLTLDQIAARKQSGQGWGQVFQSMKAQGLVQDRTLGQVVSRYQRQEPRQVRVEDSEPSASVSHEGSGHGVGKSK
jgi:hypothetical protein